MYNIRHWCGRQIEFLCFVCHRCAWRQTELSNQLDIFEQLDVYRDVLLAARHATSQVY